MSPRGINPTMAMRWLLVLLILAGCTSTKAKSPEGSSPDKPNILFVLTDDMRLDDLQFMPNVRSLIGDQGAMFDNYFDNVSVCCPARASILRGQYSHNTGVLTNRGSTGGFETAHALGIEDSTIATALQDHGYSTALFGKYLNGYPKTVSPDYVPPGWSTWSSPTKGTPYNEYNYTLNQNGQQVVYGHKPDEYGTDVYVRQTRDFINDAAKTEKPFFAYLSVFAPHWPAFPATQDLDAFPGLTVPRTDAFNEADIADKPKFIHNFPLLDADDEQFLDALYRRRAQTLQAVDRGVATLIEQLRANQQLERTFIFFVSDNGLNLGEHRLRASKQSAYETDIHLPLLVRGPGITAGTHVAAIAGNVDLAPTMAELAGTTMTDNPDGRSLAPLFAGSNPSNAVRERQAYLLEHWQPTTPDDSASDGTLEPDDTGPNRSEGPTSFMPEFQGLRVAGYTYVEYATGERELYDLAADPQQLNNIAASANPALIDMLHQRLEEVRRCAGDSCRTAEDAPLQLPR